MGQEIQLKEYWEKTKRRRKLSAELALLREEKESLAGNVTELERKKEKEQKDAKRLERAGVRSFFYALTGKKKEKLEKKRAEADAAQKAFEEASLQLEALNSKIELVEKEWKSLDGYEEKFQKLLDGKRKLLSGLGNLAEKDILSAERKLSSLKLREKVILELAEKNKSILEQAERLQKTLMQAEQAETVRKYAGTRALDRAQKQTGTLQKELEEFTLGIKAVFEGEEITANLDMVYQFCNGIYTSYIASNSVMQVALLERIRGARGNTRLLVQQLHGLEERLLNEKREILSKKRQAEELIEMLIIDA